MTGAIHGFGRIGRSLMKVARDGDLFVPVSISDIKNIETLAALFELVSNYGPWSEPVGTRRESKRVAPSRHSVRPSKTYRNLQAHSVKNRRFRKDHRT
jgi:glyceraldehyde-3-phosphate dehydrogenase/erythrose-4-phosphate dehydrogenase